VIDVLEDDITIGINQDPDYIDDKDSNTNKNDKDKSKRSMLKNLNID